MNWVKLPLCPLINVGAATIKGKGEYIMYVPETGNFRALSLRFARP